MSLPLKRIQICILINPRKFFRDFRPAGFHVAVRSAEKQEEIRRRHEALVGKEQYEEHLRKDRDGNEQGASGKAIFGFDKRGIPHEAVTPFKLHDDFQGLGYFLTNVYILVKPTKENPKVKMYNLILNYEPEGEEVKLTERQLQLFSDELYRYFGFVHVHDNEVVGTASVNASHAVPVVNEPQLTDPRLLRLQILENGEPQWVNEPEELAAQEATASA